MSVVGLFEICVIIALFILMPDLFLIALTILIVAGIIYLGILSLPILLAIGAIYIVVALFKAFFTKITQPNDIVELDEESQELFLKHIDDMGKKRIRKFFKYILSILILAPLALLAYNEIGIRMSGICLAEDEVARIKAYKLKGDERKSELKRVSKFLRDNDYADGLGEHKESGEIVFMIGDAIFPIEDFFYDISYAKYKVIKNINDFFDKHKKGE